MISKEVRIQILERDNYSCQICHEKAKKEYNPHFHVHHIIPRTRGGTDTFDNLVTLCSLCHKSVEPHPQPTRNEINATLESIRALPKIDRRNQHLWNVLLKIDDNLKDAFKDLCYDERITMSQKIIELIDKELQRVSRVMPLG